MSAAMLSVRKKCVTFDVVLHIGTPLPYGDFTFLGLHCGEINTEHLFSNTICSQNTRGSYLLIFSKGKQTIVSFTRFFSRYKERS